MPWCIWTTIQPYLQKLEMAGGSAGTAKNRLWDKLSLPPIRFKICSLTPCKYNYVFCDLIGDLKSEISPAPCDKKCCSEHQTLFTCAEGLGIRLLQNRDPCFLVIGKPHPCWIGLLTGSLLIRKSHMCYLEPRSNWYKVSNCKYVVLWKFFFFVITFSPAT